MVNHSLYRPASTDQTEFGNYIGGDLESDDESDIDIAPSAPAPSAPGPSAAAGAYAPLEGLEDDDEAMDDEEQGLEMTLHGVDGESSRL
jgi:U5 small nuclear ribonucleoprotein component